MYSFETSHVSHTSQEYLTAPKQLIFFTFLHVSHFSASPREKKTESEKGQKTRASEKKTKKTTAHMCRQTRQKSCQRYFFLLFGVRCELSTKKEDMGKLFSPYFLSPLFILGRVAWRGDMKGHKVICEITSIISIISRGRKECGWIFFVV